MTKGEHRGLSGEFFGDDIYYSHSRSHPPTGRVSIAAATERANGYPRNAPSLTLFPPSRAGKVEAAIPGGWYLVSDLFLHDATNAVISSRDLELVPTRVTSLKRKVSPTESREGVR